MAKDEIIPPISPHTRRVSARHALVCIGVAAVVLLLFQGPSIRNAGERMDPGVIRSLVLAVGEPAGWLGDRLPLDDAAGRLTSWVGPEDDLAQAAGGFETVAAQAVEEAIPPVTPDAFEPRDLGRPSAPRRTLRRVLVTGDSMVMPLDAVLGRRFADGRAIEVTREPHVGTGISKSGLVDWGKLATRQATLRPDAVVVFVGANEGFPIRGADGRERRCCDAAWAAEYAFRARSMMNTYRREGDGRVYWLTLPLPRDRERQRIARAVNAAIRVAAQPYRAQVRVLDMAGLFTPGGSYREAMTIGAEERLVREADGIHLNQAGAELAADEVVRSLGADFENAAR